MTNVVVRRQQEYPRLVTFGDRDPLHLVRSLLRWDPFREMAPVSRSEGADFSPAFDVAETKDGFLFKADIPGVKESDLEITLTGNRLSISGKREADKQEAAETYYSYERSYGSFTRVFTLPDGIDGDNVKAQVQSGVLSLLVPKKPETQPRTIAVNAGGAKS